MPKPSSPILPGDGNLRGPEDLALESLPASSPLTNLGVESRHHTLLGTIPPNGNIYIYRKLVNSPIAMIWARKKYNNRGFFSKSPSPPPSNLCAIWYVRLTMIFANEGYRVGGEDLSDVDDGETHQPVKKVLVNMTHS